jgi:GxxExxY protein
MQLLDWKLTAESAEDAEKGSRMFMTDDELTEAIIGAAIEVHRIMGPGLLESAYEECLAHELALRGIPFQRQLEAPVVYKGTRLDCGFRMDLLIDGRIIVEIKAVESLNPVHMAQVLTYLRLTPSQIALLINFNVRLLKNGIKRVVLEL